jgi:hypothetical protein
MPPIPRGLSTLWLGPATNPSSDIEILKRSLDTSCLPKIWSPPRVAPRGMAEVIQEKILVEGRQVESATGLFDRAGITAPLFEQPRHSATQFLRVRVGASRVSSSFFLVPTVLHQGAGDTPDDEDRHLRAHGYGCGARPE